MKVTVAGVEYTCDSALRGDDYVLLFTEGIATVVFNNVVDFDDFVLSGGEWTYPYVTLDPDAWETPKATGTVTITGTAETAIPAGTVLTLDTEAEETTTVKFKTAAQATIGAEGTVDVAVVCTAGGPQGNVAAESTFTATDISGVTSITNEAAFTGGDSEPFTQEAEFVGVTASNNVLISTRTEGMTLDKFEAYANALIEPTYQGEGYIRFTAFGYKPEIDLEFNVKPLF